MPLTFKAGASSGSAPEIADGEYPARFDGVVEKTLEKSQFDPNVFVWSFTLLSPDGKVLYDGGEPITADKLTSRSTNVTSKTTPGAVRVLKALMTAGEFTSFKDGESEISDDDLVGRIVTVDIEHNENGWPTIAEVRRRGTGGKKTV